MPKYVNIIACLFLGILGRGQKMLKKTFLLKDKEIHLRSVAYGIILFACVVLLLCVVGIYQIDVKYHSLIAATDEYIKAGDSIDELEEYSKFLTDQSREYIITQDVAYIDTYFEKKDNNMSNVLTLGKLKREMFADNEELCALIDEFLTLSDKMTDREMHSMTLLSVRNGVDFDTLPKQLQKYTLSKEELAYTSKDMLDQAYILIYGKEYMQLRSQADDIMRILQNQVGSITKAAREDASIKMLSSIRNQRIYLAIIFLVMVALALVFVTLVLRPIYAIEESITKQERLKEAGPHELQDVVRAYNHMLEINVASRAELAHEAEHDALTGLLNRGAFEKIKGYLSETVEPTALLLLDVDNFKGVNDTYGHQVGDKALKKVAGLLKENFRTNDYPARTGGDEFAVIMTNVTPKEKNSIRAKINSMNEILSKPEGDMPRLSLSVGIAFSQIGYKEELYNKADEALYKTKENGKCGLTFYGDWK